MDNLLLFVFVVLLLLISGFLLLQHASRKKNRLDQNFIRSKWQKIERKMKDAQYSMAVIEADKLLDEALKKSGVRGETMGERLKNADGFISDIDRAWSAHKVRNKIVHESSFTLNKSLAQSAIQGFKKSLKSLGAKL